MTIAARVMWYSKGRPSPAALIEALKAGADYGVFSSVEIVEDHIGKGCWHTARRAWLSGIESGADHTLILNDDAILTRDFCEVLPKVVAARPDRLISLFAMDQTVRRFAAPAFAQGLRWVDTNLWCNGLGMVMPRELARKVLQWIEENLQDNEANDELGFQLYMLLYGPPIAISNPSLVQHDPGLLSTKSHHYSNAEAQAFSFLPSGCGHLDWGKLDGANWCGDVREILGKNLFLFQRNSPVLREWRFD